MVPGPIVWGFLSVSSDRAKNADHQGAREETKSTIKNRGPERGGWIRRTDFGNRVLSNPVESVEKFRLRFFEDIGSGQKTVAPVFARSCRSLVPEFETLFSVLRIKYCIL